MIQILMHFDPNFVDIYGDEPINILSVALPSDVKYKEAVQETLGRIIRNFPSVTGATVVIKTEHDQPIPAFIPPTATIVMTTAGAVEQSKSLVAPAATTVAGAVSGLTLENVSVVINGVSYHPSDSSCR